MDYLTVTVPGGKSYRRELESAALSVGRSSQNDLILEDPGVSRVHARITRASEGWVLTDAGGKNGTFLNGTRISAPVVLRKGDMVRVGSTTLIFDAGAATPVEFVDGPLPAGSATTVLQARDVVTGSGTRGHLHPAVRQRADGARAGPAASTPASRAVRSSEPRR